MTRWFAQSRVAGFCIFVLRAYVALLPFSQLKKSFGGDAGPPDVL